MLELHGFCGGMREWTIRLAWKATHFERGTRVRIPLPPPWKTSVHFEQQFCIDGKMDLI